MARTPQGIFRHHVVAIGAGDVDAIVSDYAEDAVLITPQDVSRGRNAVRQVFTSLLGDLPDAV
jgi:ketosteroid isomerase-like protein